MARTHSPKATANAIATRHNRQSAEALTEAIKRTKDAQDSGAFEPLLHTSARWKEIWADVVASKPLFEWQRTDIPLMRLYTFAILDLEEIQAALKKLGVVQSSPKAQANVTFLLSKFTSRMNHVNIMYRKLGLGAAAQIAAIAVEGPAISAFRNKVNKALNDGGDEDDGLLAGGS